MKQQITEEQFNELNEEKQTQLIKWARSNRYGVGVTWLPLLSIGQMIEFLDDNDDDWKSCAFVDNGSMGDYGWEEFWERDKSKELCDALWKEVKEVFNT